MTTIRIVSSTDPTIPWATLGACEAATRQVEDSFRYVGTAADQPTQDPHVTVLVRKPMAETDVPIQLNRRARRAARARARRAPRRRP